MPYLFEIEMPPFYTSLKNPNPSPEPAAQLPFPKYVSSLTSTALFNSSFSFPSAATVSVSPSSLSSSNCFLIFSLWFHLNPPPSLSSFPLTAETKQRDGALIVMTKTQHSPAFFGPPFLHFQNDKQTMRFRKLGFSMFGLVPILFGFI